MREGEGTGGDVLKGQAGFSFFHRAELLTVFLMDEENDGPFTRGIGREMLRGGLAFWALQ